MVSASQIFGVEIEHINVLMLESGAEEQFIQTTVRVYGSVAACLDHARLAAAALKMSRLGSRQQRLAL